MDKQPKKDSEKFLEHLTWLVDKLYEQHKTEEFLMNTLKILTQSRHILWRPHWLKLRRYILEKMEK